MKCLVLAMVVCAELACGDAGVEPDSGAVVHHHGEAPDGSAAADGGEHHVRDPVAEPCDATNWTQLLPDLRACDLAGAELSGENLRRADLSAASLADAKLVAADLFKAVLTGADLRRADAAGANLTSTDCSDADLTGADLRGARLTNAELAGAALQDAATDETTTCVAGTPGPCW